MHFLHPITWKLSQESTFEVEVFFQYVDHVVLNLLHLAVEDEKEECSAQQQAAPEGRDGADDTHGHPRWPEPIPECRTFFR